ncbi:MAG: carbonic anhydrase [Firmicutes bacterium]|nr:carbonic anhydrase [Bacillota bacterium]
MDQASNLPQVLQANRHFLATGTHAGAATDSIPERRLVIVTCMDTRLVGLLEDAMGITQGDAKIVKVAGAQVRHPFGSAMHSILIAVHMLQAREIMIVGHHDCGMRKVDKDVFVKAMMDNGVPADTIRTVEHAGVDIGRFLERFDNLYDSVRSTVSLVREHPFLSGTGIPVHGLVIDPLTGALEVVVDGTNASTPAI